MIKKILFLFSFFILQSIHSQVTFVLESIPENTPENAAIYISGDFESWTGGQSRYLLQKKGQYYFITLPKQGNTIRFKFTQGNWETAETNIKGNSIDNRTYTFKEREETVKITILNWDKNTGIKKSTAAKNVSILSDTFKIPQLNRDRKIWIYLPPTYKVTTKKYPVIYMHDGQNLFDNATSFSGEWEIDETLNQLYKENGFEIIVIGINNGGKKRLDEYSPWKNEKYGGGEGEAYVEFITQTLKPYVDKNYRTKSNKEHTAIMGSSMGGLISFYTALKYPNVFGKVGVFSPSFWFSEKSYAYAKTYGTIKNTKMYFLAGGKEDGNTAFEEIGQTVKNMNTMVEVLQKKAVKSSSITSKIVPEGEHNEKLWKNEFKEAVQWLFNL